MARKLRAIRAKYPGGVTYQDEARARVTGAYLVFPDFGYWHAVLVCAETGRVLRDDNCLWVRKQARIYEIPIIREAVVIWS